MDRFSAYRPNHDILRFIQLFTTVCPATWTTEYRLANLSTDLAAAKLSLLDCLGDDLRALRHLFRDHSSTGGIYHPRRIYSRLFIVGVYRRAHHLFLFGHLGRIR